MRLFQSLSKKPVSSVAGRILEGRVIDNKDPEGLHRVRVEIPGNTDKTEKENLPWLVCISPLFLGSSPYSGTVTIPQINTTVAVIFQDESMTNGYVIGQVNTRPTDKSDPLELTDKKNIRHPEACNPVFTNIQDGSEGSKPAFSPSFKDDYPFVWGWIDNALNWFKVNMKKRTLEFVTNGMCTLKTYGNGDTIIHISGNLKVVVDKDSYIQVNGNSDFVVNNHAATRIGGNKDILVGLNTTDKTNLIRDDDALIIYQN